MSTQGQSWGSSGAAIRVPPPPGRNSLLVFFLVILGVLLTLYRTSDRGLFTAHEARAARCARNMLRAEAWPADRPSPWLVPQFSPDADPGRNYQKPPLYYWAVAATSRLAGEVSRVTVRLPSALSLILLVVVTYYLGRTLISVRAGFIAALVLLATPKILWWGRAAILDPMLAACIAGSLLFFFRAHLGRGGRWQYWLFWGLAGLGMLVKATALVVPLLTVGLYLLVRAREDGLWRSLWRIKPITGPLVLLAVAAPWHLAAHVATAGEFTDVYWGRHVFGRAAGTGGFQKQTSWYFYFVTAARDLFPWIVFLPGALVQPWRRASRQHRARLLFPFVWFVGAFVFFSAVCFRKDEYLLAAYPAAAMLVGYFLDYYLFAHPRDAALKPWVGAAFWIVGGAAVAVAAALLALSLSPGLREWLLEEALRNETSRAVWGGLSKVLAGRPWLVALLVGPTSVGGLVAAVLVQRHRPAPALGLMCAAVIFSFVAFVLTVIPILNRTRGLSDFADVVRAEVVRRGAETKVLLGVAECHQLAFLLDVSECSPAEALKRAEARLTRGERALVIMDEEAFEVLQRRKASIEHGRAQPVRDLRVVGKTPEGHRRPLLLVEPAPRTGAPGWGLDG